ncbi:MAG: hypothetical protein AAGJ95_11140 [Cyanobacteria bacterium J06554_11]
MEVLRITFWACKRLSVRLRPIPFFLTLAACSNLPGSYEARLANHLSETGAKMYGAYWCPHCAVQKDAFGGAVSQIPYVECDLQGFHSQAELCAEKGIAAYPTWIIEGEYYLGSQPLGRLARLSGFEGLTPLESDTMPPGNERENERVSPAK